MKPRSIPHWVLGLSFSAFLAVGCSDGTEVTLAKVPAGSETPPPTGKKQETRLPKKAVRSPDVLPGPDQPK